MISWLTAMWIGLAVFIVGWVSGYMFCEETSVDRWRVEVLSDDHLGRLLVRVWDACKRRPLVMRHLERIHQAPWLQGHGYDDLD